MRTKQELYQEVLRTAAAAGARGIARTPALSTLLILGMKLRPRAGSQPIWEELAAYYDAIAEEPRPRARPRRVPTRATTRATTSASRRKVRT